MAELGWSSASARRLEDVFFHEQDRVLIAKLKELRRLKESKEALARVSGIADDAILRKLVDLQVRPETLAALVLIPLIEVAWADGVVDEREKAAIRQAAPRVMPGEASLDVPLLERWLERRPPPELLDAWRHYLAGLAGKLDARGLAQLRDDLLGHARAVAEASGGFLGLTSRISAAEREMLERIERAFQELAGG